MRSNSGVYPVVVGRGEVTSALRASSTVVVVDASVERLLPEVSVPRVVVRAGEDRKTLAEVDRLAVALREAGVQRSSNVLGVGGGFIQDLVSFVAAAYMRGIDWSYAPTTLMAMADSCIGGKSSINAGGVKNLLGLVHPPQAIYVDPQFLAPLGPAALTAGLSESAKISFCRGVDAFEEHLEHYAAFAEHPEQLIVHSLATKTWFVEVDEFDRAERRRLNFGHTFGHAVERASGHRINHGVAVAVGMLCALAHPLSERGAGPERLEDHCRALLSGVPDLSDGLLALDAAEFERAFRGDKKHAPGELHLILPAGGAVAEVVLPDSPSSWESVHRVLTETVASLVGERVA